MRHIHTNQKLFLFLLLLHFVCWIISNHLVSALRALAIRFNLKAKTIHLGYSTIKPTTKKYKKKKKMQKSDITIYPWYSVSFFVCCCCCCFTFIEIKCHAKMWTHNLRKKFQKERKKEMKWNHGFSIQWDKHSDINILSLSLWKKKNSHECESKSKKCKAVTTKIKPFFINVLLSTWCYICTCIEKKKKNDGT